MSRIWTAAALSLFVATPALSGRADAQITHLEALSIDGAQETPPVTTTATGRGDYVLDVFAHTLDYNISFQNLSSAETQAHFHGPAPAGTPAGILFTLPLGSPKIGTVATTATNEADLLAGLLYTNIHSQNFTSGEIRGQMLVSPAIGTAFCFGDGTGAACPCANNGQAGHGCENSATTGGAVLAASGRNNPDNVVLVSSGELPNVLSLFLQGDQAITAVPFGDGLSCVGGQTAVLAAKHASGGAVAFPAGAEVSITARSTALGVPITPGSTRRYLVYYRDSNATFCPHPPDDTFNATNSIEIQW